jgi:carbon monoxide dehydrogenase subunit G
VSEQWHDMKPVGLEFLDEAPKRYVCEARVAASPSAVWQAICDASGWSEWFPGVEAAGYADDAPGIGSLRWSLVAGVRYEETMLVWDKPSRWGYRIDRATGPIARAHLEITELEPDGDGTRVCWRVATDPAEAIDYMADGTPFGDFLQGLHVDAMKALEGYLSR